ncbi:MAG TPA: oxidoreductase-like domain-containing protein [Casimicrobiaceae bacterium]|jgi:hypothetical protein
MAGTTSDDDRKPAAPEPPEPADCCGGGCERCVYDLHEEAMDRWREALRQWQARHAPGPKSMP